MWPNETLDQQQQQATHSLQQIYQIHNQQTTDLNSYVIPSQTFPIVTYEFEKVCETSSASNSDNNESGVCDLDVASNLNLNSTRCVQNHIESQQQQQKLHQTQLKRATRSLDNLNSIGAKFKFKLARLANVAILATKCCALFVLSILAHQFKTWQSLAESLAQCLNEIKMPLKKISDNKTMISRQRTIVHDKPRLDPQVSASSFASGSSFRNCARKLCNINLQSANLNHCQYHPTYYHIPPPSISPFNITQNQLQQHQQPFGYRTSVRLRQNESAPVFSGSGSYVGRYHSRQLASSQNMQLPSFASTASLPAVGLPVMNATQHHQQQFQFQAYKNRCLFKNNSPTKQVHKQTRQTQARNQLVNGGLKSLDCQPSSSSALFLAKNRRRQFADTRLFESQNTSDKRYFENSNSRFKQRSVYLNHIHPEQTDVEANFDFADKQTNLKQKFKVLTAKNETSSTEQIQLNVQNQITNNNNSNNNEQRESGIFKKSSSMIYLSISG